MQAIPESRYRDFLAQAGIEKADPRSGIGKQLTYTKGPRRTIVIHFAESDAREYVETAMQTVLNVEDEWLLVPRHGSASDLGLIEGDEDASAVLFGPNERSRLGKYLCTRPMDLGAHTSDLYAISASGHILVTWDHHTADEGLDVQLLNVKD